MSLPRTEVLAVDIVICSHDYGEFLVEAIESALAQTHEGTSVIVVDDGSADGSPELLSDYVGRPGMSVVLKENGGQATALNAGVERCRGDVVMFLDADDRLRPEAAASVAQRFGAHPGLSKVQFRMVVVDAEGRSTGATKPTAHLRAPTGDQRRAELSFPFDLPWLPGGGTAFRLDALRRIFPIPVAAYPQCGADWYPVHLTALLGDAAALDEVCADYRLHGRNAYEREGSHLDLAHIRDSIVYAAATAPELARLADEIGLERPRRLLSVSDVGNRLISLRLDPEHHPVGDDRVRSLVAAGMRAAGRRFDVTPVMRGIFVAWFLAIAVAPRPLARRLAEAFALPERRPSLNRWLRRMQRRERTRTFSEGP